MVKKTTSEFINESIKVHGDKYDYSKVEYINKRTKVCIICPEHGEFWQRPSDHLCGNGCYYCGRKRCTGKKVTTESFIDDAKRIHGNKYDYSKTEYVNSKTKVCIICPEHGEFWQLPSAHLNGQGCPKCKKGGRKKYDTETFIERAKLIHGDKYDYSKTVYRGSTEKVCIICPEHGEFWQEPSRHLMGDGCRKCANEIRKNAIKSNYIENAKQVHGDKYDYSKTIYNGYYTKVCIICPEHGEFWQLPTVHLHGCGCPKCSRSKLEESLSEFLDDHKINYVNGKKFPWLGRQHIDFYLPDYNIGIECQGIEHFKSIPFFGGEDGYIEISKRDIKKKRLCHENGIKLLYFTDLKESNFLGEKVYNDRNNILKIIREKP